MDSFFPDYTVESQNHLVQHLMTCLNSFYNIYNIWPLKTRRSHHLISDNRLPIKSRNDSLVITNTSISRHEKIARGC